MSRMVVLKPDSSKKVGCLLKTVLYKDIQEQKRQTYLEKVLKNLYKNYQANLEQIYYQILTCIDKWHIEWFSKSFEWRTKDVLLKISHITFPRMKTLSLSNLEILSVEAISWMDLPNVETINLSNNSIRSVKSLAKGNHKKLQNLFLEKNEFSYNNFEFLSSRINVNNNRVNSIQVGSQLKLTSNSFLVKIGTRKMERTNEQLELLSQVLKRKLKQKWS